MRIPNDILMACGRAWFAVFGWVSCLTGTKAEPVRFDLPAQPAAEALVAFAKQAGVEVLFSFDELNRVRANALAGEHEPGDALATLLAGTGFTAERDRAGKFLVLPWAPIAFGEVRGCVIDEDGEPIPGATIRLEDAIWGVRTRHDGWFLLPRVPAAPQTFVVEAAGFVTLRVKAFAVQPNRRTEFGVVRLERGDPARRLPEMVVDASDLRGSGLPSLLEQFVVTPSRFALAEEHGLVAATLTESDLLALPQFGEDLYRAISHLPGLAADDLTARFWVRGAPHDQVLARLDGVELVEPFHMKDSDSSLAILDLGTVRRLDLHTGAFGAEFGRHGAGVLTMETDRHFRARPETSLNLSLTGARVANRGMARDGRSRWLVSARTGYPDVALEIGEAGFDAEIVPRYHDVIAKWETSLSPRHVVALEFLHAGDRLRFLDDDGTDLRSRYGSDNMWTRWEGEAGTWRGETVLSHTELTWRRIGSGVVNRRFPLEMEDRRALHMTSLRHDSSLQTSERALIRAGFELKSGEADFRYRSLRDRFVIKDGEVTSEPQAVDIGTAPNGSVWGGYLAGRLQPRIELTVEAGLRYDANDYADDSDLGPRLNAAWNRGPTTLRVGWGYYHQMQALHRLNVMDGDATFRRAERAEHRVVGVERRLSGNVAIRIEAYERRVARPQPHWDNVVETMDAVPEHDYDRRRIDPVSQRARGVEFIAEKRAGALTWSASYALARAEETLAGGKRVPRAREQRQTVYVDVTYTPNPRWQFSVAWQSHSGWPTTAPSFQQFTLADGFAIVSQLEMPYNDRLPAYQRLDLRVQRRIDLKRGTLRLYADVFNALNRRNVFSYDYDATPGPNGVPLVQKSLGDRLVPLLPSVGLAWDF